MGAPLDRATTVVANGAPASLIRARAGLAAWAKDGRLSRLLERAVPLLLLATASVAWHGYRFGGGNHSVQIPLLKHYADPSLYRHDALISSSSGYVTFFFPAAARVARWTGIEPLWFALFVFVLFLGLAAVYALAMLAFRRPASAVLACLFYLSMYASLSAEATRRREFVHSDVAAAILLWAIYAWLRQRPGVALALCGLTLNVHALYAAHVTALLLADALLRRRHAAREVSRGLALCVLLGAPALVWLARSGSADPIESLPDWLHTMRQRSAHHAFPLSIPLAAYARYLLLVGLGGLAWSVLPDRAVRSTFGRMAIGVVLLCLAGVLFGDVFPWPPLIRAQLLRSTKWLTYLLLLAAAELVVVAWAWGAPARVAAVLLTLGILIQQPAWLALALAILLVARRGHWTVVQLALGGGVLLLSAASAAAPLPEGLSLNTVTRELGDLIQKPVTVACLALFLLIPRGRGRLIASMAVAVVVTAVILPHAYRQHRAWTMADPWVDVQVWTRQHTERDAVLLTPPEGQGFRVFSERAIVGEWKDGTQQFFSARYGTVWAERMRMLSGFDAASAAELRRLAGRFGARYLVYQAGSPLPLSRVYANADWVVYDLAR